MSCSCELRPKYQSSCSASFFHEILTKLRGPTVLAIKNCKQMLFEDGLLSHDNLPDWNRNKVFLAFLNINHYSDLFYHAEKKAELQDDLLRSENDFGAIVNTLYKIDPISACSYARFDNVQLLRICRSSSNSYASYEDDFSAALSRIPTDLLYLFLLLFQHDLDSKQQHRSYATSLCHVCSIASS